jgi:hypothetical protein
MGVWCVTLNVLLNRYECSLVRAQACAFLINLVQTINRAKQVPGANMFGEQPFATSLSTDEESLSISANKFQLLLQEVNFYPHIAYMLSTFYPYDVYTFEELKRLDKKQTQASLGSHEQELSICSPVLVGAICQLLYNITVLMGVEVVIAANNHGILNLLISYIKPLSLLSKSNKYSKSLESNVQNFKLNEDIIDMLHMICRYLNLCCIVDRDCVLMLLKSQLNHNLIFDLFECLNLNATNKGK